MEYSDLIEILIKSLQEDNSENVKFVINKIVKTNDSVTIKIAYKELYNYLVKDKTQNNKQTMIK